MVRRQALWPEYALGLAASQVKRVTIIRDSILGTAWRRPSAERS